MTRGDRRKSRMCIQDRFKIGCPKAANKLRALIAEGGDAIEGPFDG